jgi:hypothetical protein
VTGSPLQREEWRLAGVQLLVASVLAVGAGLAWLATARLPGIEPGSPFELLLAPTLWQGLALVALAYMLAAASIGWLVGLGAALTLLATAQVAERRRRPLLWLSPALVALPAIAVGLTAA